MQTVQYVQMFLAPLAIGATLNLSAHVCLDWARLHRQGINGEIRHVVHEQLRTITLRLMILSLFAWSAYDSREAVDHVVIMGATFLTLCASVVAARDRRVALALAEMVVRGKS